MSQSQQTKNSTSNVETDGRSENLRDSPMMAHLLDALEAGTDIGHYGRLTFVMVARHFLEEDEMVELLSHQPDHNETEARALIRQVQAHDYNPPKRERILEWQAQQDFPICPTPDEPGTCNVYSELRFPSDIYENINDFWEEQAEAESGQKDEAS
jgi:DNA primase large subunit